MSKMTIVLGLLLVVLAACGPTETDVDVTTDTAEDAAIDEEMAEEDSRENADDNIAEEGLGADQVEQASDTAEENLWLGVTTSRVKLRQGPSTETEALAIDYAAYELEKSSYDFLFLGQKVKVIEQSGEKETIGDYEPSYWYRVEAPITDAYGVTGWIFGAFVDPWDEALSATYAQTLAEDYASARSVSQKLNAVVAESYLANREETLAAYPFLQADVSAYEAYLLSLDMSDLSNVVLGAEGAKSFLTSDNGDELLYAFTDFQEAVLTLSLFNDYEYVMDEEVFLEKNGFMVLYSEGDPGIHTDPAFLQTYFGEIISPIIGDHFDLLVKEQNQHPDTYVFSDAAMMISWEALALRIGENERYIEKYGDDPIFDYVGKGRETANDFYIRIYLGDMNMDNTPIYNWVDKTIRDGVIESYEHYLLEYPDSKYASMVARVLAMFKANNLVYDEDAFQEVYEELLGTME